MDSRVHADSLGVNFFKFYLTNEPSWDFTIFIKLMKIFDHRSWIFSLFCFSCLSSFLCVFSFDLSSFQIRSWCQILSFRNFSTIELDFKKIMKLTYSKRSIDFTKVTTSMRVEIRKTSKTSHSGHKRIAV